MFTPRSVARPRHCPRCGNLLGDARRTAALAEGVRIAPSAVVSFLLGVTALLGLPLAPLLGTAAFFIGAYAKEKIERSDGKWSGSGLASIGMLLGILAAGFFFLSRTGGCPILP